MTIKTTRQRIIEHIRSHGQTTVKEVAECFKIERRMAQYHLKSLLEAEQIQKIGKVPRVFYVPKTSNVSLNQGKSPVKDNFDFLSKNEKQIIEDNFLLITPAGQKQYGLAGFAQWCEARNVLINKKAKEYLTFFQTYAQQKEKGFFSGKQKLQDTFGDSALNGMWYLDIYAWPIFGKTKLGQLLLYAKQSQNREIINEILEIAKPPIYQFLKWKKVDAVAFVPPSIKREIQFMHIFRQKLNLNLPIINVQKAQTEIVRPQKTLSKLNERIENAQTTMFVLKSPKYKTVLILDDAVGSGATLHEIAQKIKRQKQADVVFGLSITGSAKGFDVISEV